MSHYFALRYPPPPFFRENSDIWGLTWFHVSPENSRNCADRSAARALTIPPYTTTMCEDMRPAIKHGTASSATYSAYAHEGVI